MEYDIKIPHDEDGFTTFQCFYCKEEFKLKNDEVIESKNNNLYCPICGLTNDMNKFYTNDIYEKALEIAEKEAYNIINKAFGKLKSSKNIKFNFKEVKSSENKTLIDKIYNLQVVDVKCCNIKVKVRFIDKFIGLYCPYCGRDNIES